VVEKRAKKEKNTLLADQPKQNVMMLKIKKKDQLELVGKKKSTGGPMSKFGMDDGVQTSYEKKRGQAIENSMKKQNRVKLGTGGFVAKGCGAVMNNKRKVTTIS
jgi:hypothetical protein